MEDTAKTPGPAGYNAEKPKKSAPSFSMPGRTNLPTGKKIMNAAASDLLPQGVGHKSPAPGDHNVETVRANKPSAPGYTMGRRHSEYTTHLIA